MGSEVKGYRLYVLDDVDEDNDDDDDSPITAKRRIRWKRVYINSLTALWLRHCQHRCNPNYKVHVIVDGFDLSAF